jgi:hypothetical protein
MEVPGPPEVNPLVTVLLLAACVAIVYALAWLGFVFVD